MVPFSLTTLVKIIFALVKLVVWFGMVTNPTLIVVSLYPSLVYLDELKIFNDLINSNKIWFFKIGKFINITTLFFTFVIF